MNTDSTRCCRSFIDFPYILTPLLDRLSGHKQTVSTRALLMTGLLLTGLFAFGSSPAYAVHGGTPDGICMVDRYNGDRFTVGDGLNPDFPGAPKSALGCTSNDVQLAIYEVVSGPATCLENEIITVRLKGNFIATSAERWDVGVFIAEDGGTPNDTGGSCYSDYLHPVSSDNTDLFYFCADGTTSCTPGDNSVYNATCAGQLDREGKLDETCSVLSSGAGPYYNGEITEDPGDMCADIKQGLDAAFVTGEFDIVCQDSDGDLLADVTSCTVWANARSDGSEGKPSCTDEFDVSADTSAKCTCDAVNIIGIDFEQQARIEVVKDLVPDDDSGLFNLQIDALNYCEDGLTGCSADTDCTGIGTGACVALDVGDAGTTTSLLVGAGTVNSPGATHTVGETAGTSTSLGSYTSSISCVDRGLTTFGGVCSGGTADGVSCDPNGTAETDACVAGGGACNANGSALTLAGSGPLDVPVVPGQDILCTITNSNACETAVCDDSACATFECDPNGAVDNCDIVTYTPGALCRTGSGDICDPDEYCVDQQAECPVDVVTPATTVCNPGSGDVCDPDESCTGVAGDACPADSVAAPTTICRPGSGDICDPDESCTGNPDEACPADAIASATTVCNPGSGDVCDPDESCTGVAGEACPADSVAAPTTICRPGSGDICDPDESCTGNPDEACPADAIASATTVCNPGSGDVCDPDESCTGVAGDACPDDSVAAPTTICRPGSGDICDPDESCTGNPDEACPADAIASATTICNPGSGDVCDPDESCTGVAGEACPDDAVAPATTICNPGSGDLCDPDESCTGNPDEACPDDVVAPATTVCNPGSGDICDQDESCTGVAGDACPDDVIAPATTICNPGSGDICDPDESCTGLADEACPDDVIAPATTICRESGTGDEVCDPPESCTGTAGEDCPDDFIEPPLTPCGDGSTTECTDPDTCDGLGYCEPNNKVCGSATNSQLCEYDMEPTKGSCVSGDEDGSACFIDDACIQGGGTCDNNICLGGTLDGADCTVPTVDPCVSGGGSCVAQDPSGSMCVGGAYDGVACCYDAGGVCEQTDQFRLLFSPDVQQWVAYKLNASNPGQTFYNVIYDASAVADGDDVTLSITIPYPYITVGGNPLHVYDAETVGSNGSGCLDPSDADTVPVTAGTPLSITLTDWLDGSPGTGPYNLFCDAVPGLNGSGSCTFDVTILHNDIPEEGLVYLNVHLDYGLKGQFVDANTSNGVDDRYDRHPYVSPWGSSDALEDTSTDDGSVALADCRPHWFEHTDGVVDPLFEDQLQNLNIFKRISGAFGRVYCADSGDGFEYWLDLVNTRSGESVAETQADEDGYYALSYKHKGKPTDYLVTVYSNAAKDEIVAGPATIELQGNGWSEVNFWATDCDTLPLWDSSVTYGSGRNKAKK